VPPEKGATGPQEHRLAYALVPYAPGNRATFGPWQSELANVESWAEFLNARRGGRRTFYWVDSRPVSPMDSLARVTLAKD
jgi:hypothetical protein